MSALPPEADMLIVGINVCFVPKADIERGSAPRGRHFHTMLSVTLAPAIEGLEHGAERLALLGEVVLIAGRVDLV
jgi:hypothetical protein